MNKILSVLVFLALLLAACGILPSLETQNNEQDAADSAAQSSETVKTGMGDQTANEAEEASSAEAEVDNDEKSSEAAVGTTPSEREQPLAQAEMGVCQASPFPVAKQPGIADLTDADWQHGGGAEARVQVIEYGDFQ